MAGVDQEVAKDIAQMILLHNVSDIIDYTFEGKEIVPHCFTCGYFGDKEDPALHTANVVLEFLEERTTGTTTAKE